MGILMRNGINYSGNGSSSPSIVTSLSDLSDVQLTSLANGQGLFYDDTLQKWVNKDSSSGGTTSNGIEWGIASLMTDITTATPIGYTIPFNNYFTKSTVTMDKENHGFILKAGKTYELEASIRTIGNNAWRYFRFYDNNQQMYVGILGCCETTNSTADGIMPATLIVTPEVDTLYTVKVCNTSSETSTSTILLQSHFKVVELASVINPELSEEEIKFVNWE